MPRIADIAETTVNHWQRRLDIRRDELHLRVSELARRSGIPRSTVNRILYGALAYPPDNEQIRGLAKALRQEYEVMLAEAIQAWYPDLQLLIDNDGDSELLVVAKKLSDRDRRTLLQTARAMLEHDENGG